MIRICLTVICLSFAHDLLPAQTPIPLAATAAEAAKRLPKGGIVTAESVDGKVTFAAAGTLEPMGTQPEKAIFEIGSITKVFTGLLLAQAVLEKKVTLDTPLRDVMGQDMAFADPRVGAITLRQLATHTSGLPRIPDDLYVGADPDDPYAHYDRARLDAFMGKVKLSGELPFESSYSNLGIGLLGDVLSRVYGQTWGSLIEEKITRPLGMTDTVMTLDEEQQKRLAPPYDGKKAVKPWNDQALAGCGALRSTAADMLKFGEALLAPEKTPLKDAIRLMQQPQTPAKDIGLGLMLTKLEGQAAQEHGGGTGGYRSILQVIPGTRTVRVILSNNGAADPESVIAATRHEKPRLKESDKVISAEKLSEYEGVYRINPTARFTVLRRGDQLWTQLTGQSFLRLFPHEKEDRFFFKIVAAEIQFNRENGRVISMTNHQNGRELTAKKSELPVPTVIFRSGRELAEFAGTYELTPQMVFTLRVHEQTLYAQLTGQPSVPVFERSKDRFEYDVVSAALEFERDKEGRVTALKLHQFGLVQRAVKKDPSAK